MRTLAQGRLLFLRQSRLRQVAPSISDRARTSRSRYVSMPNMIPRRRKDRIASSATPISRLNLPPEVNYNTAMNLHVGTTGFSQAEWRGNFYPQIISQKKML